DLARWIACFWEISGTVAREDGLAHRVLPDGCADLIFDLQAQAGKRALVGPMSTGRLVELRGAVEVLGVRLRPGAVGTFLGIAADQLLDVALPLEAAPVALRVEWSELAGLADTAARVARLTAACRVRAATLDAFDPVVAQALASWRPAREVGFPTISVLVRD